MAARHVLKLEGDINMPFISKDQQLEQKKTIEPLTNIEETEKDVLLEMEMPGISKQDIDIELQEDRLGIKTNINNKEEDIPKGYTAIYRERFPAEYSRTFILGDDIAQDNIDAQFENGVLRLRLAKSEKTKPKKITIK
jgi:HSP20 family protein